MRKFTICLLFICSVVVNSINQDTVPLITHAFLFYMTWSLIQLEEKFKK